MKYLIFSIVLSGSLIISSTGCSTRVLSKSSNTGSNITPIPIALSTPASEDANSPEQPLLCNTFLKKGKKLTRYVSSLEDQKGTAIKVTTTSFKSGDDALMNQSMLYPPKKGEQREDKYFKVIGLNEITLKGVPFAYLVTIRISVSGEKELLPNPIVFRCVDKAGKGEFEKIGSEDPLIVPEWILQ